MEETRLQELLKEATVYCRDEEEAFWGLFCALENRLTFPIQAQGSGGTVTIVALDGLQSGLAQGAMARVRSGNQESTVPLSELEITAPNPPTAEWLAVYRYWREKGA